MQYCQASAFMVMPAAKWSFDISETAGTFEWSTFLNRGKFICRKHLFKLHNQHQCLHLKGIGGKRKILLFFETETTMSYT